MLGGSVPGVAPEDRSNTENGGAGSSCRDLARSVFLGNAGLRARGCVGTGVSPRRSWLVSCFIPTTCAVGFNPGGPGGGKSGVGGVELGLDQALERRFKWARQRNAGAAPRIASGVHAAGSRRGKAAWSGAEREEASRPGLVVIFLFSELLFLAAEAGAKVKRFPVGARAACHGLPYRAGGKALLCPSRADPVRLIPQVCAPGLVLSTAGPGRLGSGEPAAE